jgi:hypothetical protein
MSEKVSATSSVLSVVMEPVLHNAQGLFPYETVFGLCEQWKQKPFLGFKKPKLFRLRPENGQGDEIPLFVWLALQKRGNCVMIQRERNILQILKRQARDQPELIC